MTETRSKFGPARTPDGIRLRLWAPSAEDVRVVVEGAGEVPMQALDGGWREAVLAQAHGPEPRYGFEVDGTLVPDPASRFQPEDVAGPSQAVDGDAFAWTDTGWRGRPWEECVLYETHVGTATPEGTYAALADKLDELARIGITALSLLPLAEFAGSRNWGYDGVLPFAPESAYGTPDDLRGLVDRAHALGIAVVLDVVYNHFGPSGNYLPSYAKIFFTERHETPWGAGINFDGEEGVVRDFFMENALYWLTSFHIDGLRFDAVHAILDDSQEHFVGEVASRIRGELPGRHVHLILENEHNEAKWLERGEDGRPVLHTAQWNDDIHHCWHVLLTGETESYYGDFADHPVERLARCLAEGFAYQGEMSANLGRERGHASGHLPPSAFVSFLQNHDQVGNRALGDRISAPPERLALARAALLLSPQIPMLFMGEEWGASTPFQFFVDFSADPDLSKAVREGRRKEFASFASFAGHEDDVPDPTDEATFRRSKLDWAERAAPPHAAILADTAALLALRAREIVPVTKTAWQGADTLVAVAGSASLDVRWCYAGGTIRLAANIDAPVSVVALEPGERMIWSSPGVEDEPDRTIGLPPWTGLVLVGPARPAR